jgi:endo-alpha-N-acetylgalactosaminidase
MTATADSENATSGSAEGPASNVLDGDAGTIWHTQYDPTITQYPHWLTLDLKGTATVSGFGYLDRQSGGQNGRVKDYTVSVSANGTDWTPVAAGSLVDSPSMQVISFPPVSASYVKFTALTALNGQPFAAAAEMRVYGTSSNTPTGVAPGTRSADDACSP